VSNLAFYTDSTDGATKPTTLSVCHARDPRVHGFILKCHLHRTI